MKESNYRKWDTVSHKFYSGPEHLSLRVSFGQNCSRLRSSDLGDLMCFSLGIPWSGFHGRVSERGGGEGGGSQHDQHFKGVYLFGWEEMDARGKLILRSTLLIVYGSVLQWPGGCCWWR